MTLEQPRPMRGRAYYRAAGKVWTTDNALGDTEFPLPDHVSISLGSHKDPATPDVTGTFRLLCTLDQRNRDEARAYPSIGIALDVVGDDDLAESMSVSVPLPRANSTFGLRFERPICWLSSGCPGIDVTVARSGKGSLQVRSDARDGVEWHLSATSDSVTYLRTLQLDVTATNTWPARRLLVAMRSEAAMGPALNFDLRLDQIQRDLDASA